MAEKDYAHKHWRCRRCKQKVDLDAFRCGCTESPSPWEPVDAQGNTLDFDPDAELLRLRELVKLQKQLIDGYGGFMSAMPFCAGDMIKGYNELVEKIDELS